MSLPLPASRGLLHSWLVPRILHLQNREQQTESLFMPEFLLFLPISVRCRWERDSFLCSQGIGVIRLSPPGCSGTLPILRSSTLRTFAKSFLPADVDVFGTPSFCLPQNPDIVIEYYFTNLKRLWLKDDRCDLN